MSSWIGGSISSLTGQLSNLTKDILSEGTEEITDIGTELRLAKEKIQEQDSVISTQRAEIGRLKTINKELEEKAESSELQINSISREYRNVLESKEKEVNNLKKQTTELLEQHARAATLSTSHNEDLSLSHQGQDAFRDEQFASFGEYKLDSHDWHFDDNIRLQQETNVLRSNLQRTQAEVKHWKSVAGQLGQNGEDNSIKQPASANVLDLQHKVKDLEAELSKKGDLLQQQAASLNEHHRQKLSALKERHAREVQKLQEKISSLEQELEDSHVAPNSVPNTLPESDLQNASVRHGELEEKLEAAIKEKDKALNARSHLEGVLEELQQEVERLQFVEEQHEQRSGDAKIWQNKLEELHKLLEKSESEKKQLKQDLENVETDLKNQASNVLLSTKEKRDEVVADLTEIIESIGDAAIQRKTSELFDALERENVTLKEQKLKLEEQVILLEKVASTASVEELVVCKTASSLSTGLPVSKDEDSETSRQKSDSSLSEPESSHLSPSALHISQEEVDRELSRLRQQFEQLQKESSNFEMEKADWLMEKEALEDVLTDLRNQSKKQEEAILHLKSIPSSGTPPESLSSVKGEEEDKGDDQETVATLEKEVKVLREEKLELEKSVEELDSQHSEAVAQLITQRNKMANDIQEKEVVIKQYQSEIQALNQTITELKEICSARDDREELEQKMAAYEEELSELRENDTTVKSLEKDLSEMTEKLQKGGLVINDLHMDKQELEEEVRKLKEEMHAIKMEVKETKQEKKELQLKIKDMEEQLSEMEEEVERWERVNEERQLGLASVEKMEKEECRQLRTQIEGMEKEREVLREEFQHLIHDNKPPADLSRALEDSPFKSIFEEEIKVRKKLEQDENIIEEMKRHIEQLQSRKHELKKQVVSLEQDLIKSNSVVEVMKQEKANLEEILTQQTSDLQNRIDLICQLEKELTDLRQRAIDEERKEGDKMEEMNLLSADVEGYKEKLVKIQTQLREYEQTCQNKDYEIDSLKAKVANLESNSSAELPLEESVGSESLKLVQEELQKLREDKEKMESMALQVPQLELELAEAKRETEGLRNELSKTYATIACNEAGITDLNNKSHELSQNLAKAELEHTRQESTIAVLRQNSLERDQVLTELQSKLNFLVSIMSAEQIEKLKAYQGGNVANNAIEYQEMKAIQFPILETQELTVAQMTGTPSSTDEGVLIEEIDKNEDRIIELEKQLEELQKRLAEKDVIVSELQKSNSSLLGLVEKGGGAENRMTGQVSIYKLEAELQSLRMEREQMVAVVSEKSRESSSLKQEIQRLMEVVSASQDAMSKLQQDNATLERERRHQTPPREEEEDDMRREALANMARLVRDRETEIEALKQKNETLLAVLQETKESEAAAHLGPLLKEKETLTQQIKVLTSEREQLITCIQQKHSESLSYHNEVQRLAVLLEETQGAAEKARSDYANLIPAFEDKSQALVSTQTELMECKQKLTELEIHYGELVQRSNTQHSSASSNSEELEKEREKHRLKENELKSKISQQDGKIESLAQKVGTLEEVVSGKEAECMHVRKQLDNSKFQLTSLMSEIADIKSEKEQIQQRHNSQDEESVNLRDSINHLTLSVKDKELQITSLNDQIVSLNSLLRDQEGEQSQVAQLMREKEAAMANTRRLQQENELSAMQAQQRLQECSFLKNQIGEMKEKEQRLGREVERLRTHLIEMEEGYTKEALESEEREKELRNRLATAEEQLLSSTSQVHLASQESHRQIENLQEQLKQTAGQRDSAYIQITSLQEQCQQYSSSLSNLQLVLEHFQKEKDSAVAIETEKYEKQAKSLQSTVDQLQSELEATRADLVEALDGLDAASRISEQLDKKEEALTALKEEVQLREQALGAAEEEIRNLRSNTEAKVDKTLMHNMMLTWLTSPEKKRTEIVQLIGHVLDFTADDFNKIEAAQNQGGLLIGFFKRTSKPSPQTTPPSNVTSSNQSFSQLFVKFLERESSPPPTPVRLPAEAMAAETQHKHKTTFNPFMAPRHVTHEGPGARVMSQGSSHLLMSQESLAPSPLFAPMNSSSGHGESAILKDVLGSQR